jgi:hypothetical protein
MKKITIAGAAVAAVAGPLVALGLNTATAFADAGGYCSQPGCLQHQTPGAPGSTAQGGGVVLPDGTVQMGASSGSFGAFGTFGDVKHDQGHPITNDAGVVTDPRGANGPATGANNSGVMGNNGKSGK